MDIIIYLALSMLFGGLLLLASELVVPTKAPKLTSSTSNGSISSSKSQSPLMRSALEYLDTYKQLSADALISPLAPNFTNQGLPSSLGMPQRTKAEYAKHASMVTSIFTSFAMLPIPGQVFEDSKQNVVVAHCKMVGELTNGLGPWENECIMTLRFDEQGRIIEHREFVDSAKAATLRSKLMGAGKGPGGPPSKEAEAGKKFMD
jgi:hypothetical protein